MTETKPSDERFTPEWVLERVRAMSAEHQIDLDVCTTAANPTGAVKAFTKAHNGLRKSWEIDLGPDHDTPVVWCNPPYSRGQVIQWARKATVEALPCDSHILMLTQADVSTQWFQYLAEVSDAACLLGKRIAFLDADGQRMPAGAKFGSAIWYYGPDIDLFRKVWSGLGRVVVWT